MALSTDGTRMETSTDGRAVWEVPPETAAFSKLEVKAGVGGHGSKIKKANGISID